MYFSLRLVGIRSSKFVILAQDGRWASLFTHVGSHLFSSIHLKKRKTKSTNSFHLQIIAFCIHNILFFPLPFITNSHQIEHQKLIEKTTHIRLLVWQETFKPARQQPRSLLYPNLFVVLIYHCH